MAKGKPIKQVTPPTRARSGRPPTKGGGKANIPFVNKTFGTDGTSTDTHSSSTGPSAGRRPHRHGAPNRMGMQD